MCWKIVIDWDKAWQIWQIWVNKKSSIWAIPSEVWQGKLRRPRAWMSQAQGDYGQDQAIWSSGRCVTRVRSHRGTWSRYEQICIALLSDEPHIVLCQRLSAADALPLYLLLTQDHQELCGEGKTKMAEMKHRHVERGAYNLYTHLPRSCMGPGSMIVSQG